MPHVPPQPPLTEELLRRLAGLVDEWRRLEAVRMSTQQRGPRPAPPPYRDLTAGDLQHAQDEDHWLSEYMAVERSERFKKAAAAGRGRCEAGVKEWDFVRCQRSSPRGEKWCTQHHPSPAKPPPLERRLNPWDLRLRPDGDVISELYRLNDHVREMDLRLQLAMDKLERAERRQAGPGKSVLDATQAAELLGVSRATVYAMCRENRLPYARLGSRYRFQASQLDAWLSEKTIRTVRRGRPR